MATQTNGNDAQSPQHQQENPQKTEQVKQDRAPSSKSLQSISDGAERDANGNNQIAQRQGGRDLAQNQQDDAKNGTNQPQNDQQLAPRNQQVENQGKGAPSVKLDMDLDVEIELKAKIKGDLELAVLDGDQESK